MPAVTELAPTHASPPPAPTNGARVGATLPSGDTASQAGRRRSRAEFVRRSSLSRLHVHLVLLLLVGLVPTAGLLLRTTFEQRRHAGSLAQQDTVRWARALAAEHERTIEMARQLLTMLAQLPDVRQQRPDRCNALVGDLLRRYSRYANLGAMTLNGSIFCSAAPPAEPIELAGRARFFGSLENVGFEVGEYRVDRVTGRATVNVSYPLGDDAGTVQGAVFAAVDLTGLARLAALARLPEGSTVTISDRQGRVRVRFPDPARWVGPVAWGPAVVDRMVALGEGSATTTGPDGIDRFVGFTPLPSTDGGEGAYLAVAIPREAALAAPDAALAPTLLELGLIAALGLVAARLIGHRIIPRHGFAPGAAAEASAPARNGSPSEDVPEAVEPPRLPPGPARGTPAPRPVGSRAGDRRLHPRDPVSWPARVWLHAGGAAVGRVVDASLNGMRVAVAGPARADLLELGGSYRIEVLLPGTKSGVIRVGELRHVGDRTIGLSVEEELPRAAIGQEAGTRGLLARLVAERRQGAA
jgi:hypothetical protein